MPNLLVSGPAGAGKSAVARERLQAMQGPAVVVDFQSLYLALRQEQRGPDGQFPVRDEIYVPLVAAVRGFVISQARQREFSMITTNSDSDQNQRDGLLRAMGGGVEQIVDPGRAVVIARLSGADGILPDE